MPASTPRRSPRCGRAGATPRRRSRRAREQQARLERERERLAWQIGEVDKLAPGADEWDELNAEHTAPVERAGADRRGAAARSTRSPKPTTSADALRRPRASTRCRTVARLRRRARRRRSRCCKARRRSCRTRRTRCTATSTTTELDPRAPARARRAPVGLDGAGAPLPPPAGRAAGAAGAVEGRAARARRRRRPRRRCEQRERRRRARLRRRSASASRAARAQAAPQAGRGGDAGDAAARHGRRPLRGGARRAATRRSRSASKSVEFLVAGHAGSTPRPLAKVASGGELSRIALAIAVSTTERSCRRDAPATLIFDEIDAGVGGAVAETVGRLMKQLGRDRQVLAVTHLPQVAACADHHFVVSQATRGGGTDERRATPCAGEARVAEIARMLGGEQLSGTSLAHAQEMLARRGDARASTPRASATARRQRSLAHGGRRKPPERCQPGIAQSRTPPDATLARGRAGHRHLGLRQVGGAARARGRRLLLRRQPAARAAARLPARSSTQRARPPRRDRGGRAQRRLAAAPAAAARAAARRRRRASSSLFLDATTDALVRRFSETRRRIRCRDPRPASDAQRALVEAIELERELLAELREVSTVIDTSQLRPAAAARAGCASWCGAADSRLTLVFEIVRLQARRAARRRLRVRRARAAQPALHPRAAAADRARRRRGRLPRGAARGGRDAGADRGLPAPLAAGVRGRPAQLPDGGDRLHRRPAPLGLLRRAAGRALRRARRDAGAPSRTRRARSIHEPQRRRPAHAELPLFPLQTRAVSRTAC